MVYSGACGSNVASGAAWKKRLAMEFGAGEDRAQVARQPPGEGICFLLGAGEILADLDEKAGEPPTGRYPIKFQLPMALAVPSKLG